MYRISVLISGPLRGFGKIGDHFPRMVYFPRMDSREVGQIWADHGPATPLHKDTCSGCSQAEAGWEVSGYNERSLHEVPKMRLRGIPGWVKQPRKAMASEVFL